MSAAVMQQALEALQNNVSALQAAARVLFDGPASGSPVEQCMAAISALKAELAPPKVIMINGVAVPEPMRVEPSSKQPYWLVDVTLTGGWSEEAWDGTSTELGWLVNGLCHATRKAAIAHAEALLSFSSSEAA